MLGRRFSVQRAEFSVVETEGMTSRVDETDFVPTNRRYSSTNRRYSSTNRNWKTLIVMVQALHALKCVDFLIEALGLRIRVARLSTQSRKS